MHPLDNPAWHALNQAHRPISVGNALARRYAADISPIAALADPRDPDCWAELAALTPPGQSAGIFQPGAHAPVTLWDTEWRHSFWQMHCDRASFRPPVPVGLARTVVELTLAHGPAMVALARLTRPGPMEERTVALGRYLGVFDDHGELIAMAGERMRLDGMVEVSAVCTHPEHRGHGYARALVALVAEPVLRRGVTLFLHVKTDNADAARVYEQLGFSTRTELEIASFKRR